MLPSGSVPISPGIGVLPAVLLIGSVTYDCVTGGILAGAAAPGVTGIFTFAVLLTAPLLSVAVKVKTALPLKPVAGVKVSEADCAGVRDTVPAAVIVVREAALQAVGAAAQYFRVPCAAAGAVTE